MPSMHSRPQCQSRWTANGVACVVAGQLEAFSSESIDVRSLNDFLAKATYIAVPQVISHDVDQIRPRIVSNGDTQLANRNRGDTTLN